LITKQLHIIKNSLENAIPIDELFGYP